MANNPTTLQVYFYGHIYTADALPRRYLPTMMLFTLTEPVWPLAGIGFIITTIRSFQDRIQWRSLWPVIGWLVVPMLYVLLRQPPMYDGFRHFLFIAPPLFVLGGIALDALLRLVKREWILAALIVVLVLPGIIPAIRLHPYEYTYYNQLVGGTGKAAKRFETDYWMTCYKDAVEQLGFTIGEPVNLFVKRGLILALTYAPDNVNVRDYKKILVQPGDFVLYHSRDNPALQRFADTNPHFLRIEREGAIYCEIRKQQP